MFFNSFKDIYDNLFIIIIGLFLIVIIISVFISLLKGVKMGRNIALGLLIIGIINIFFDLINKSINPVFGIINIIILIPIIWYLGFNENVQKYFQL